jgi:hypothetical protein
MKQIYKSSILVLTCVLAANCFAGTSTDLQQPAIDPTLVFFTSLSTCTPGIYNEQNDVAAEVGQSFLKQEIVSLENGICNVKLTTPDNRIMACAFPMQQMTQLTDQHFLQGMLQDANNSDQDGVNAEELWSNLKISYCSFGEADAPPSNLVPNP